MPYNSESGNGAAAPLVEVLRGPIVESRHRGHMIAVDGHGNTVTSLGTPDTVTYIRSSAKPFQALPLVASGAADQFGFTEKEIAVACGSHSGEPQHVETVLSMLAKIGMDQTALKCGVHDPFNVEVSRELVRTRQSPSVLQNNCSGKHAGMLALAKYLGAPIDAYDQPDSPVQQQIAKTVAAFSDVPLDSLVIGTDGCAAPVFGLPVRAMAVMYARLISPPPQFEGPVTDACRRIVEAMINFPEMVGGSTGRLDTELIRAANGRLISKIGAEGVYTVGALPCADWPAGLGFALKVEDGDDHRARPPAVIEALRQLGLLDELDLTALAAYAPTRIKNRRGDLVGEARAAFTLTIRKPDND
jgi:L-asparaginase II